MRFRYLVLLVAVGVYGQQQEPAFSQYMYNFGLLNPAYTYDYRGIARGGVMFRQSLLGIDGSPNTTMGFMRSQLNKRMAGGINIMHDAIGQGLISKTYANVDFAYSVDLFEDIKLSFGVKYGLNFFNINGNTVNSAQGEATSDYVFRNESEVFQQLGLGLFVYSDNFFMGFSVADALLDKTPQYNEIYNFYAIAGYVIPLNKKWVLKPMAMFHIPETGDLTIDASMLINYNRNLEFGLTYRLSNTIGGLINFRIYKSFKFAYSYSQLFNDLGYRSYGTHEIGILMNLQSWKQVKERLY